MAETTPTRMSFELEQRLPGGLRLPTRMTALATRSGVVLVSPIPIDDRIAASLAELGDVSAILAPNLLHHLYLARAKERYPAARVLAYRALAAKIPGVTIDHALDDGLPDDLREDLRGVPVDGAPSVSEMVLLHVPSRALVVTDLFFHVRQPKGLVTHLVLFLVGCHGRFAQSRAWRFFVKDRAKARASAEAIAALPFDEVVVAHGDPVRSGAKEAVVRALSWMLGARGSTA
jgi:hypothetical protein